MTEKKDIKETKELLKAIKVITVPVLEAGSDGFSASDAVPVLTKIAADYKAVIDGFNGVSEIKAELADLDKAEIIEIIAELYSVVEAGEAAAKV